MSKTPRTDAWTWNKEGYDTPMEALTKFAECLEVELGVANERIKLLISERDSARAQSSHKLNLRDEFVGLLETDDIEKGVDAVRNMKERIKRLEEVGDELVLVLAIVMSDKAELVERWTRAKEAKP